MDATYSTNYSIINLPMSTLRTLFFLVTLLLLPQITPAFPLSSTSQDFSDGTIAIHHAVPEVPRAGTDRFRVSVDGHPLGLYNDRSYWGGIVSFAQFEFTKGQEVTIDIAYDKPIHSYEVLPKSLRLNSITQTSDTTLRIVTAVPDQHISIIPNEDPQQDVLHLFAQSIDPTDPHIATGGYVRDEAHKLHYFGPGYYDLRPQLKDGTLNIESGWTVYLAAGAVVQGQLAASRCENIKVLGRGMMFHTSKLMSMHIDISQHITVEGVLFFQNCAQMWQVPLWLCSDIDFRNVKILCTHYASTDGLDIHYCQNGRFRNMFIRANDDCITVKGMDKSAPPSTRPANRDLLFDRMQLWNDCNNAFTIGEESATSIYRNIRLTNSCILHSYDDPNHHDDRRWCDSRAAWSIISLDGTYFQDILIDNLDVHYCQRLISIGFYDKFWNNPMGNQKWPGGIRGVTLRNITSYRQSTATCANDIQISGWTATADTPAKWVDGVVLDNITIAGRKVKNLGCPYLRIGEKTKNIIVRKQQKK